MHLRDAHVACSSIDVLAVAGEGDAVYAVEPVGRRNHRRSVHPVRVVADLPFPTSCRSPSGRQSAPATARATAPGLRSRLGDPSSASRCRADRGVHGRVAERAGGAEPGLWPSASTGPGIPTTAPSFSSATVVAGSFRSTWPLWIGGDDGGERVGIDLEADGARSGRRRSAPLRAAGVCRSRTLVAVRVEAEDVLALGYQRRIRRLRAARSAVSAAHRPRRDAASHHDGRTCPAKRAMSGLPSSMSSPV